MSHERLVVERPELVAVALEPEPAPGGVQGSGDRRDPGAADLEQVPRHPPPAAEVVGGDVAEAALEAERDAAGDHRDALPHQRVEQGVAAVRRDREDAVDVPGADVGRDLLLLLGGARDHEQQRHATCGERLGGSPQEDREVRVLEEQVLGFGEQERHRVRPSGDQAARVLVGGVAGGPDGLLDGRERVRRHPVPAVDDARDRAPGHAGRGRDVTDRRALARRGRRSHRTRL